MAPDIPAFTVPASFHSRVLDYFDGSPSDGREIDPKLRGELNIQTRTGTLRLMVFSPGDDQEIVFKTDSGGKYKSTSLREFVRTVEQARQGISVQRTEDSPRGG